MRKIGIMGTHGTGKTTLAFQLAYQYKKTNPEKTIFILPGIARLSPFPLNENANIQGQRWIYHKQMTAELENQKCNILICDRTILDNLAYSKILGFECIVENYLNSAISWLQTYWKLYWLRPEYPIMADGVRNISIEFQAQIDSVLNDWIKKYSIPIIEINKEKKISMDMKKIKELIISHEGLKFKPYRCTAGKLTIGVGRNIEDVGISKDEAMFMLNDDIETCIKDMVKLFPGWHQLSKNQQAVLINMRFNLGPNRFRKFKRMITAINDQNYNQAAREMIDSLWYRKQVGNRAVELVDMWSAKKVYKKKCKI